MKNRKCPNRSHCWDYKSGNCENCDLGDHILKLHKKIDRLKANNEELIYKLECLLCHATGSKLSKHTYDLRTMELAVNDYVETCCEEARAEAKSEIIDEFASELKEYLDDTYSTGEDVLIDINDLIDYIAQKMKGGAE